MALAPPPTTPYADFCVAVRVPLSPLSPVSETPRRSPEVSSIAFSTQPPGLRFALLMDTDFAVQGLLVQRSRLIPGSCSSAHAFAPRFFQTGPRGSRPCALLALRFHQPGQRTFTSQLSNMLGTPCSRRGVSPGGASGRQQMSSSPNIYVRLRPHRRARRPSGAGADARSPTLR